MAFYEATELEERERFLKNCDVIGGPVTYSLMPRHNEQVHRITSGNVGRKLGTESVMF